MIRPWFLLPPHLAHSVAPLGLKLFSKISPPQELKWKPLQWKGLSFSNRLGIAAGVDKEARQIESWTHFGAGFMEIGTVTPRPQKPNPGRILNRDTKHQALWNKMGFPGPGAESVYATLSTHKTSGAKQIPIWVNIGKNRDTPNERAEHDYAFLADKFSRIADALVINISSPNTKGLRDLQGQANLERLVTSVRKAAQNKPLLLKLSPDLSIENLKESLDISGSCGVDGWVLTNTTLSRTSALNFPEEGGVSGEPLRQLSRNSLETTLRHLGSGKKDKLVVSCGGILDAAEAKLRLEMGADLLESYSALALIGPKFLKNIADCMKDL